MDNLTARQITQLNDLNINTQTMEFGQIVDDLIDEVNALTPAASTPVNGAKATGVLTLTDVVIDGETVVVDNPAVEGSTDTYEFCADVAQTVTTEGNIAVDITASTTAANNTLTIDTQPTSGDTMTLGSKTYIFVPDTTDNADGEITIGTDLATAQAAILAAIAGTDGHNVANTQVAASAFAADVSTITALVGGVAGDSIATTETFTAGTNVFSAATLGSGADCSAANAITALAAAVTASDTQGVGAADGAGDTVDFTADAYGTGGNAITTTETMANASFGAATLEGGVTGTAGVAGQRKYDADYDYVYVSDAVGWKRNAISTF